jgi:hypothetical protein
MARNRPKWLRRTVQSSLQSADDGVGPRFIVAHSKGAIDDLPTNGTYTTCVALPLDQSGLERADKYTIAIFSKTLGIRQYSRRCHACLFCLNDT